ncbi:MAG: serine hydrolase domain-containing protein [Christensenellales bacterium]
MDLPDLLMDLLLRGLEEGCYPGAAAACGDASGLLIVRTAGRIMQGGPDVTPETRYDMGSLTKILSTSMLAFIALERGELTLDDTLGRFFPGVPEDKRCITVRQIMTHTAGFIPSFRLDLSVQGADEAIGEILSRPLSAKPGETALYSCMGYILLGKILEGLFGEPLDLLAQRMVFQPLGMLHTAYLPKGGNIAATECDPAGGDPLCGLVHDENARFLGGVSGNAGVFSTIGDMVLFAKMLSLGGSGFLSPAMMKQANRCHTEGREARRGLGFHLAGTPENFMGDLMPDSAFGHTGFPGTSLAVDPETGFFAVLLSNRIHPTRENTKLFRFRRILHNVLYARYTSGRCPGCQGPQNRID